MAYYGKGTKEAIMASFSAALTGLSGIAFVDYQRVYDSGIGPEKFPGAFINDVLEAKEQVLKDIVRNTLTIGVICWVRAEEGETLWTKLNTFVQSITAAVRLDPTRGNQAYDTRVTQIETDAGSRHPVGLAAILFDVVYFSGV